MLWFGDERGYNATALLSSMCSLCCGLVMKEDITQRNSPTMQLNASCGLVMKEDITQHFNHYKKWLCRCGLVMKEDITQRLWCLPCCTAVVVW